MAARCASVGACEYAGCAIMNVAAAIDAQIIAARFDVSFIFQSLYIFCFGSRRFKAKWSNV
jgi:hypothetical protein